VYTKKFTIRFIVTFLVFIACFSFFCVKLIFIQVFKSSHLTALANKQHNYVIELEPIRGSILDRNLRPLAFNVSVPSLYANPKIMTAEDKNKAIAQLPSLLGVSHDFIEERLRRDKYFVWLKRKVTKSLIEQVKALKIQGVGYRNESKRFYPNHNLSAHVIGFAGLDNEGLEGLELVLNKELKGKPGQMQILRDARQRELMIEKVYVSPQDGFDVVLTIDETIQYIVEQALDEAMESNNAKAGTVIVMDTATGEILALANRPTYNLDQVEKSSVESRTNRAISFVYEPGSIFKFVTAAAALEEEKFVETDKIYCEKGEYRVANHILHDHTPHGTLSFREVFEVSSNIGVTKIAQKLGPAIIFKYGKRFRFGEKTGINLKGEVEGHLKPPSQWSKTTIGAIPIGHEVTTTPLQMLAALASVANDGVYMKPFVVRYIKDQNDQIITSFEPTVVDRVISPDTAKRVKEILIGAVDNGTGKKAQIKGVRVAGKTGTAQKVVDGLYSHNKYYSSFIGFAPADNPRLAAIVVFDEPYPRYFGGTVAAPVFQQVIEKSLKYLKNTETTEVVQNSSEAGRF